MSTATADVIAQRVAVVTPGVPERIRAQLAQAVRAAWASPDGIALRSALSAAAQQWGAALKNLFKTRGLDKEFESLAEQLDLSGRYRRVWGKA